MKIIVKIILFYTCFKEVIFLSAIHSTNQDPLLQSLIQHAPTIKTCFFNDDVTISISNLDSVIYYLDSDNDSLHQQVAVGRKLTHEDPMFDVIRLKKKKTINNSERAIWL